jgi:hypothetical protein
MTPDLEKRAEEIVELYVSDEHDKENYKKDILEALRQTREEAIKEERDTHWQDWEQIKKDVRKEALEEAAKVMEFELARKYGKMIFIVEPIVRKIRALASSGSEGIIKGRIFNHRDGQTELDKFRAEHPESGEGK